MTNYTHTFFDAQTGETIVVDFTKTEIDIYKAEIEAQTEAIKTKAAARQAVLDKLGLTADEANALFG